MPLCVRPQHRACYTRRSRRIARIQLTGILVAGVLLLGATAAVGGNVDRLPERGLFGASWVANISTEQYVGLAIFHIRYHELGWFIEGKFGKRLSVGNAKYYSDLDTNDALRWRHPLQRTDSTFDTGDIGLTFGLNDLVFAYAGVGISDTDRYGLYYDASQTLGVEGNYWVNDTYDHQAFNACGGVMVRVSRLAIVQAGYNSSPASASIGLGVTFEGP